MLYHILENLSEDIGALNVFKYLSFRSMISFVLCLTFVLVLQPVFIGWFKRKDIEQPIREDGPQSHLKKKGTPTMGGVVVVSGVLFSFLLLADLTNVYVWVISGVLFSYAILGFLDDYAKVNKGNAKGVSARFKLLWQILIAVVAMVVLKYFDPNFSTELSIPFFKNYNIELGYLFIPFATLIIVGSSNAVNLTDGLDGLVIGPVITVSFAYGIFAYLAGNLKLAEYLNVQYVAGCGDLAIFASAIIAGGLGFLWFNAFPAQVFMGDVGSLSLGGAIGTLAILCKQELLLIIAGGVFVVEALSVIAQVFWYKTTGERVLLMAPIHHHFELKGLSEPKIIVRCWILSIVLAIIALATIKLR